MRRKGLSQVLALIVAASVLMMTALTVIFMVQGGLADLGSDTSVSSCTGAIEGKCAATNANVNTPSACLDDDNNPIPGVSDRAFEGDDNSEVNCGDWNR